VNQTVTTGIVLRRTNYGEADRIVTFLTKNNGKIRVMARGVRKQKSKMAGGIELFCVCDITFIRGKGEIGTLISGRLKTNYGSIIKELGRVQLGYDLISLINRNTEDETEAEYFELLNQTLAALDDLKIKTILIKCWFQAQLLRMAGHTPNLITDTENNKLEVKKKYNFDFDDMTFTIHPEGHFTSTDIKTLRLLFDGHAPLKLNNVTGLNDNLPNVEPLINTMLTSYLRV